MSSEPGSEAGLGLEGKIALVTGAGTGIGQGVALALAKRGVSVVAAGRTASTLDHTCRLVAEAGGRAIPAVADIMTPDGVRECVQTAIDRFGRLDILINN